MAVNAIISPDFSKMLKGLDKAKQPNPLESNSNVVNLQNVVLLRMPNELGFMVIDKAMTKGKYSI